jgi:hypothetical protein
MPIYSKYKVKKISNLPAPRKDRKVSSNVYTSFRGLAILGAHVEPFNFDWYVLNAVVWASA